MLKTFIVACATLAISASAHADDLIRVKSGKPVKETLDTLQKIVTDDGFFIVGRVPHSEAAKGAGLTLRPTELLIFGKPQGGPPLMVCNPAAGIDLPLRAVSWQDEAGQVWLAMLDLQVLKQRYTLPAACDAPIKAMDTVVRKFLSDATGS